MGSRCESAFKGVELDPRSIDLHIQLSQTYEHMRRFPEKKVLDQAIAIAPDDISVRVARAFVDLEWRADPKPLRTVIEKALAKDLSYCGRGRAAMVLRRGL